MESAGAGEREADQAAGLTEDSEAGVGFAGQGTEERGAVDVGGGVVEGKDVGPVGFAGSWAGGGDVAVRMGGDRSEPAVDGRRGEEAAFAVERLSEVGGVEGEGGDGELVGQGEDGIEHGDAVAF